MNMTELKNSVASEIFGMSLSKAKEEGVCVKCHKPVNFYNPEHQELAHDYWNFEKSEEGDIWTWEGASEYNISGLCEHCFEKIFQD